MAGSPHIIYYESIIRTKMASSFIFLCPRGLPWSVYISRVMLSSVPISTKQAAPQPPNETIRDLYPDACVWVFADTLLPAENKTCVISILFHIHINTFLVASRDTSGSRCAAPLMPFHDTPLFFFPKSRSTIHSQHRGQPSHIMHDTSKTEYDSKRP